MHKCRGIHKYTNAYNTEDNTNKKRTEHTNTENTDQIHNTRAMQTKCRPNTDKIQKLQTKYRIQRRIFKKYHKQYILVICTMMIRLITV